jgi:hypothetical protein
MIPRDFRTLWLIERLDNWSVLNQQLRTTFMRKPRDFDSELKALNNKAKQLRERRLRQLGELVITTGADALPVEQLAGLLLGAVETGDLVTKEEWRKRGAAFFQGARNPGSGAKRNTRSAAASAGGAVPPSGADGA